MPTPIFNVRLPAKDQETLRAVAKVFGSANASEFAREMLTTMCSGDPARIAAFNRRLIMSVGEQLVLTLNAPLMEAAKPALESPKKRKRKRRPRVLTP